MLPRSLRFLIFLPLLAIAPLAQASSDDDEAEDAAVEDAVEAEAGILNARRMLTLKWKDQLKGKDSSLLKLDPDDPSFLSIESTTQTGGTLPLIRIKPPPLDTRFYALRTEIRHHSVSGTAYLEMISHFPDGKGEFPSRTLAESGPMKRIEGRSRLRTVWIPFDASEVNSNPDQITLNLVMASIGKIDIGPLELFEFADAKSMWAVAKAGDKVESIRSLSDPARRVKMAFALLGITTVVGGIHFWHLKRERRAKG